MNAIDRPNLLTATVRDRLRTAIVCGDLPLGASLSEGQLADQLNVPRTPVRDSLAQLRTEGLVAMLPLKGAHVFTLSAREVVDMCEFRLTLEEAALKLAVERNRGGLVQQMSRVVEEMTRAQQRRDSRHYLTLDTDFHCAIFDHCGNAYLQESYARYAGRIAALRTHLAIKPFHIKLSFDEHVRLRDAVRDGAVATASSILHRHIDRTRQAYSLEIKDITAADNTIRPLLE